MSDDVGAACTTVVRATAQEAAKTARILKGEVLQDGATKNWEGKHRASQKARPEAEERGVRAAEE